ncbi:MAG: hypothetical protein ACI4XP_07790 [Acutalibacteraceae bacterium]
MKVKKCLSLVLVASCLCLSAIGCSNNNDSKVKENNNSTTESSVSYNSNSAEYFKILPSALTDEYIICVNNMNLEIVKGWTMMPSFKFNVLSKEPLTAGDVSVKLDKDMPFDVIYNETDESDGKFADYICCLYNNIDLSKMSDSKIAEEYDSLTDEQFPQFYNNTYTVQFDSQIIIAPETIKKMEVTVKGKTYNVDLGKIQFVEYPEENVGEHNLAFNSMGGSGINIKGSKNGIISLPSKDATVNKDIKIKDIRLANKSDTISINKVDIDLTSDDKTVSQEWKKGTDLEIKKGTDVTFNFEIKDTKFAENPNYAVNIYILVEYEADGKTYVASTQALCESRFDSQTLYAMYKDNIDFSPYFNK